MSTFSYPATNLLGVPVVPNSNLPMKTVGVVVPASTRHKRRKAWKVELRGLPLVVTVKGTMYVSPDTLGKLLGMLR